MTSKVSLLTLDLEVDPLANGGRDPVAGDTHVGPNVAPAHAVKHQGRGAHTRG